MGWWGGKLIVRWCAGTKKSGETVKGAGIDASKQVENQESGSADHLDMGMRKGV